MPVVQDAVTLGDHQDAGRAAAGHADRAGRAVHRQPPGLELAARGLVLEHPRTGLPGQQHLGQPGIEVDHGDQLGDVDVLTGQPAADHVVRVGHDLHAGAAQVGVHHAGRHEQRLAGLQQQPVHQQGRQNARVGGEHGVQLDRGAGELADLAVVVAVMHGGGDGLVHQVPALVVEAQHVEEDLGHRRRPLALGERPDHRLQLLGDPERGEQSGGLVRVAETGQAVELLQRDQDLGLGPAVLVGAFGRIQRDARPGLPGEAGDRLLARGMGLDREGVPGREQLHQVGQLFAERLAGALAEHPGAGRDVLDQRATGQQRR